MKDPAGLNIFGLIMLYTGFFGFLGSALIMIFRGFTREGKPVFPTIAYSFLATCGFFLLFVSGLILL